ncbi:MAG TPA: ParB N-terminal domain-containing protein [Terriglobia bacterium]|nr:ParB N-terminal domain-containing protein [Terriglobia bacterium]
MIQREFAYIPVSKMIVTDINMRHSKVAPDISDILPSIREHGVLQTLLLRQKGDLYEVAAGRRRYFGLKAVSKETGEDVSGPALLLEPGDDAAAIEASLLENLARQDADEMTQYETFARLLAEGKEPAEIARTFAMTERQVAQRLALGGLDRAIRDLYRQDQIDNHELQLLTLASKRQQKEWLRLFKSNKAPYGHNLKEWISGGKAITADVAIFDLSTYSGGFITDLFASENKDRLFADTAAFWELQNAAIAAKRDKYLAKGWKGAEILEKGRHFHDWEHGRVAKKDGGKVYIQVHHDGSVKYHEGYLPKAEANRIKARASQESGAEQPATDKPELTQGQVAYINAHRQAAARAALVQNPTVAFRLMVAHAVSGNHNMRVTLDNPASTDERLKESLAGNACHRAFTAAQASALAMLDIEGLTSETDSEDEEEAGDLDMSDIEDEQGEEEDDFVYPARPLRDPSVTGHYYLTERVFAKLLQLDNMQVMQIASVIMAEALTAGSNSVEAVTIHTGASLAGQWQPDALFWDQLRDREIVGAMLQDVAGKAVADSKASATGKVKKAIIQEHIAGRSDATWLPRWLEDAPEAYTSRPGFRTPEQAAKMARLFPGS